MASFCCLLERFAVSVSSWMWEKAKQNITKPEKDHIGPTKFTTKMKIFKSNRVLDISRQLAGN